MNLKQLFTQRKRAYYYRVLVAGGSVLLAYGVVDANELAVWVGATAVVLNVMPVANTTTAPGQ